MALVTNITKTINIPNEEESATIRKLSHIQLRAARKARQSEGVGFMKEMGGELLKALREADTDKIKKIQDAQEADITNYDRDTLLLFGVVSWSYAIPPVSSAPHEAGTPPAAPTPLGLNSLDEPTAKFLAEEIFNFSRPETKEEVKNA